MHKEKFMMPVPLKVAPPKTTALLRDLMAKPGDIHCPSMFDKIRCALEARRDPDFVIIGRTDTVNPHDISEGIRRANLYRDAGADMLMLFPNTVEEAKRAAREIRAPLNYVNAEHGEARR